MTTTPTAATTPAEALAPAAASTVTAAHLAAYRDAVRSALPATDIPAARLASPVHAFVLAHAVAEQTVTALTAAETGPVSVVHLGQDIRCLRLVAPGERVTVRLDVLGARREPRGTRVALRSRLTGDADGERNPSPNCSPAPCSSAPPHSTPSATSRPEPPPRNPRGPANRPSPPTR